MPYINWARNTSLFGADAWMVGMQRTNHYLLKQIERHASTFVILYEDPFDNAQYYGRQRIGWHRRLNKHNFLFLDGHAANTLAYTVGGLSSGLGWKTGAWQWWSNANDPDYQYRLLGPR
jgi:prepilin-type processing-associated H-X9-DG protein